MRCRRGAGNGLYKSCHGDVFLVCNKYAGAEMTFASEAKVGSIPDYSKVKSRLGSAESPKKAFCYGKGGFGSLRLPRETLSLSPVKTFLSLAYWIVAPLFLALVFLSLGYSFGEALLLAVLFLPGALAFKFCVPRIFCEPRNSRAGNLVWLALAVLTLEAFLMLSAHLWMFEKFRGIMLNPAFIALILGGVYVGDRFTSKWLNSRYPTEWQPVTFLSQRNRITLRRGEIEYVESLDAEVAVHATDGRVFSNRTPISHWEALLGEGFIRIHRSFLVNRSCLFSVSSRSVILRSRVEIPVSRKYKDSVARFRDMECS